MLRALHQKPTFPGLAFVIDVVMFVNAELFSVPPFSFHLHHVEYVVVGAFDAEWTSRDRRKRNSQDKRTCDFLHAPENSTTPPRRRSAGRWGLFYFPVTQCRVSDTRVANGTFGGPIMASNTSRTIPVPSASTCSGVPSNAQVLNGFPCPS
jgi:hypothetical protein